MSKQAQQRPPYSARSRPVSANFDTYSSTPELQNSMLYSMLPAAVSSRLPPLPSLRRSVSLYGIGSRSTSRPSSRSRPSTPPDDPDSAMILREGTPSKHGRTDSESTESEIERNAFVSQTDKRNGLDMTENDTGIRWKFAGQGLNLLSYSIEESSNLSQQNSQSNSSFARQLYIHSLSYLLRGLPTDLSPDEQVSIRSALPSTVVSPMTISQASSSTPETKLNITRSQPPSILHRTLASTILQLFILFQFLLPYLRVLLNRAYQYERQHRITEKVLASGVDVVDGMGRKGWGVSATVWSLGVGDVLGWVLEEVGSGVREGVGEGLVRMGGGVLKGTEMNPGDRTD